MPKKGIQGLEDLFITKIQALYDIENEIIKALPKVAKKAHDADLAEALEAHLAETKAQAERLEEIFAMLGEKPKKLKCEGIRGLVADTEWLVKEKPSPEALDAGIIASARYIEHYEMAGYLSAIAWAEMLGHEKAVTLLEETLEEERNADMKLNEAAEVINERALENVIGNEDDEEDTEEEE